MHPSIFTVLMHVCAVSSPTASSGARRSEVHSAGSPDATHRLSVASVSPTSVRFAGRRETETLYRSMDFSSGGHSVAPEHDAGYPTRFSGRSETAREPPPTTRQHDCRLVLRSSRHAPPLCSTTWSRRPWRSSQQTRGVGCGAPSSPSRRRTRRRCEVAYTSARSPATCGTSTSRWRACIQCGTSFVVGTS